MKKIFIIILFTAFYNASIAQTSGSTTTAKGCVDGDCITMTGKYLFENGDKYNGEWRDGKRYGYGRYDWKTGEWYLGDFTDDKISGVGNYHLSNGKWIGGTWVDCILIKTNNETDSVVYKNYKIPQMAPKSE